jgi:hypothetical protein
LSFSLGVPRAVPILGRYHEVPPHDLTRHMDEVTIQKIAAEVARHLPSYPWTLLAVQVVLTLTALGIGVFVGEYLKTRGKNLATKADFESLQEQLRATTQMVETIKSDVAQKDWAQREWTNLRRTKLEALLETMHDCEAFLDQLSSRAIKGDYEAEKRDPVGPLVAIGALYFPELENEIYRFSQTYREQVIIALDHALAVSRVRAGDLDAYRTAHDAFKEQWRPGYKELLVRRDELRAAARRLLVSIMGVDEHQ